MDGLSAAASVIAVIQISGSVASLCSEYFKAVKNAKNDIERLQGELNSLKTTLEGTLRLLQSSNGARLQTSQLLRDGLRGCFSQLADLEKELKNKLNPGKTGKMMSRFGVRALKWPFESKDIDAIIKTLKRYRDTVSAGLIIDQAYVMRSYSPLLVLTLSIRAEVLDLGQKLTLFELPIAKDAAFNSHAEEHNARCHPDTRVELLRRVKEWAEDPYGQCIFWLKGMAGTGKSTISRTVAQSFADNGQLGASFFFKRGEGNRGNAALFFTTVAAQLIAKEPALEISIRAAIDADPGISGRTLKEQFDKLVLEPLDKLTGDPGEPRIIVMVVDALDECEERDVRNIIHRLSQAKNLTKVKLRVFITSRPELPIRLGFSDIKGKYQDMVLHEVPKPIIEHDIAAFLEDELARIRDDYNKSVAQDRQLPLDWPSSETVQSLVHMADRLFIFAATVCRFIKDRRSGSPEQQLKKVLTYQTRSQKSKLDATYLPVLNQLLSGLTDSEKQDLVYEFRRVVGSIVLLEEPLSTSSLAHLLGIDKHDIDCRLDLLHSVLSIPSDPDSPVRLLHLSFRDFLVDPDKRETNPFWVDEKKTHKRIAGKCIQLMSISKCLRKNICNLQGPGTFQSEIDSQIIDGCLPAEVRYACRYWVYHLEQSKRGVCDNGPVHVFLQEHLLHWLEAMSLLGNASESITIITTLQSILEVFQFPNPCEPTY
jgi:hypothetical protein